MPSVYLSPPLPRSEVKAAIVTTTTTTTTTTTIIIRIIKRLNLHPNTYIQMQKSVILSTCSIVRNFLN
jgi:hypothetical protein